jgi:hypothetical protein
MNTEQQYFAVIDECKEIFLKKNHDYGTSWTIFRLPSLTDQIYIKAKRIRSIEESKVNLVGENIANEFIGIVNYCLMALILLHCKPEQIQKDLLECYNQQVKLCFETMLKKNHDYGEAWREMRISSFTDMILVKLLRIKQIEDNQQELLASEGVENNYIDCVNYAIFALMKLNENL